MYLVTEKQVYPFNIKTTFYREEHFGKNRTKFTFQVQERQHNEIGQCCPQILYHVYGQNIKRPKLGTKIRSKLLEKLAQAITFQRLI